MQNFSLISVMAVLICTACSAANEEKVMPEPTIEILQEAIAGGYPYGSEGKEAISHFADDIADKLTNPKYGPEDKRKLAVEFEKMQHPDLPPETLPPLSAEEFSKTLGDVERLVELGIEHAELGEMEEVINLSIQILEKHEIMYGPNSELILIALQNLGVCYTETEQFMKAEEVYLRWVSIVQMRHGDGYKESLHYAYALEPLVPLYVKTEAYAKAKPLAEQTVITFERYFGPNHYKLGPILVNLGEIYQNESENEKAEMSILRAIKIYENMAVKDEIVHEFHIEALEALSFIYEVDFYYKSQFSDPADVEHIWDKVLKTSEQAKNIAIVYLGEDHLYTQNLIKGTDIHFRGP